MLSTASQLWAQISGVISRVRGPTSSRCPDRWRLGNQRAQVRHDERDIRHRLMDQGADRRARSLTGETFFRDSLAVDRDGGVGVGLVEGLFIGVVPGIQGVGSLIGSVFGGFPAALAGLIGHGMIGVASLPGKALSAIMAPVRRRRRRPARHDRARLLGPPLRLGRPRERAAAGSTARRSLTCSAACCTWGSLAGLSAPSGSHGPVTGDWLNFGRMSRVAQQDMRINSLYVSPTHMGVVTGSGTGFAARSTATGTGPQPVGGGYDICAPRRGQAARLAVRRDGQARRAVRAPVRRRRHGGRPSRAVRGRALEAALSTRCSACSAGQILRPWSWRRCRPRATAIG